MRNDLFVRVVELAASNQRLRDRLRDSQETNQRLSEDVHDLTIKWGISQAKLEVKEREWMEKIEIVAKQSLEDHQSSLSSSLNEVANVKNQISVASDVIKR